MLFSFFFKYEWLILILPIVFYSYINLFKCTIYFYCKFWILLGKYLKHLLILSVVSVVFSLHQLSSLGVFATWVCAHISEFWQAWVEDILMFLQFLREPQR